MTPDSPEQKLIELLDLCVNTIRHATWESLSNSDAKYVEGKIDFLKPQLLGLLAELAELREKYNELIYAVASKYPNETRHQTALRYINQAELPKLTAGQVEQKERTNG